MASIPSEYREFIIRAMKLEKSNFWRWLTSRKGQPDMARILAGDWLAHDKLNLDELDAFCLNLRLFVQGTDGFSIRQIAERSRQWSDRFAMEKESINEAVAELNKALDSPSLVSIFDDRPTRNRDVFEVIFYGGLAHANPSKRELYVQLVTSGLFSFFVFSAFSNTLFQFRNCIRTIAYSLACFVNQEYRDSESEGGLL